MVPSMIGTVGAAENLHHPFPNAGAANTSGLAIDSLYWKFQLKHAVSLSSVSLSSYQWRIQSTISWVSSRNSQAKCTVAASPASPHERSPIPAD